MEPLLDIDSERTRIVQEIRRLTSDVADIVTGDVKTLDEGIRTLASLLEDAYELTNQLQHEALILQVAADIAKDRDDRCIEWSWNRRQRGKSDEPDLQGEADGQIVVSAEVTTSARPVGAIDRRMRDTLQRMSGFPGKRIYCVRTPEMRQRAETKIRKAGYDTSRCGCCPAVRSNTPALLGSGHLIFEEATECRQMRTSDKLQADFGL